MKRWPLRILLCLILLTGGAITTVAVAWGIGYSTDISNAEAWSEARMFFYPRGRPVWRVRTIEQLGTRKLEILYSPISDQVLPQLSDAEYETPSWFPPSWSRSAHVELVESRRNDEFLELAHGWPCIAVAMESRVLHTGGAGSYPGRTRRGFSLDDSIRGASVLTWKGIPYRPIWPGFAIDTLFYAAIWGGVFFDFTSAKRAIRVKRGRCPRCGYDLRGGVMSDKRLAMSGETADGVDPLSTQHSARSTSRGCPECGWGRAGDSSRRDDGM